MNSHTHIDYKSFKINFLKTDLETLNQPLCEYYILSHQSSRTSLYKEYIPPIFLYGKWYHQNLDVKAESTCMYSLP